MSANTKIEWADHTFNPWIGCTKVSPACDHCYASVSTPARSMKIAWGPGEPRHRTAPSNWAQPKTWNRHADAFHAKHGRRQRVFCASLADVFDNEVDPAWRAELFALIAGTPNLDWLLLTKRIGNVAKMIEAPGMQKCGLPDNVWLGATVVNQEEADRDIPKLLATPARVRFLSIEPMLGKIDLGQALWECCEQWEYCDYGCYGHRPECCGSPIARDLLDWIICGGESGPGARPMHPDWARSLRDQCASAGVPFLFKQWGEHAPNARSFAEVETSERKYTFVQFSDKQFYPVAAMDRVGKKTAGRLLDGVEHNGLPT